MQNHKPIVLILGATGQIGQLVTAELAKNDQIMLRPAARKQEQLEALANRYGNSVYIDLDQPQTFAPALQGANRLFLLTGYSVSMVAQSKTIIDAAKKAGVEFIVHLGVFSQAWDCSTPHFAWHQLIESYIKHLGFKWTFLHPNCFFQNLTNFSLLKNNKFRWYTSKPCGWIALEDLAEAAAKILIEGPEKHHAKDYWFSTESLELQELIKILSNTTGKHITADLQPPDQFLTDQSTDLASLDPYAYSVAESFAQIEDGRMAFIGNVKDDMQILCNRKGLSFEQWAKQHKTKLIQCLDFVGNGNINWG
ncbi:NmrA family NAD(P)-binding protein [Tatlockia micdadei]|uniref:NmrA family NAD(P)-binding protein n=1 Tax=Legionella micdadei TaxID=451 RepID=UPI001570590C|nr:NmrA family NAD(P)-binding protein [Legionella micdadei]NSL18323.1 NmrA family NAD(P)-binding protein [Legionella micdadei]